MIETRSPATALNKHESLQQFFKWLREDEGDIDHSPMERVRQPKVPQKLIPIIRDDDTKKLLDSCKGKRFLNQRDEALLLTDDDPLGVDTFATHHLSLDHAPEAYEMFQRKADGAVLRLRFRDNLARRPNCVTDQRSS